MTPPKLVYRNTVYSVVTGVFFLFITVIQIGESFNPGKGGLGLQVFTAIVAAACAWLTTRALVAPTITATPDGVLVRTLLKTRKYGWAEIERFEVHERAVGAMGYSRKVLALVLRNGEVNSFTALNSGPGPFGWVDEAALKLNSYTPN